MLVAWRFTARKRGTYDPSRRDGLNHGAAVVSGCYDTTRLRNPSYRTLWDGFCPGHIPGSELPGYDHQVPPGRKPAGYVSVESTLPHSPIEHEDEDDDEYDWFPGSGP